ncbi:MAG: VOC family protein [Chloroflexota bacterium]|nr:VOC family protein [Chloroflexota bacterium]MDE2970315.1 VOC family protein [Chloroflexota bacterium]
MPQVTSLGHIGLYCYNYPKMLDFYTRVLGFTVTDRMPDREACFLSARPAEEHHEILLTAGRTAAEDVRLVQQISMHVASLEDLKAFHKLFQEEGVKEERIITHGNTASIYFRDPENNYLEVYYSIPVDFPQPFGQPIDLDQEDGAILQQIADIRAASGKV